MSSNNINLNYTSKFKKICCVVDHTKQQATSAFEAILARYPFIEKIDLSSSANFCGDFCYDLIISIGGDGLMLKTIHSFVGYKVPIYGVNRGSLGFLLNAFDPDNLINNIDNAVSAVINPLEMRVLTWDEKVYVAHAFNEVSLLRSSNQSAKLAIDINGLERLSHLVGDGVILATPMGSSAYNFAAHGPLVPLDANLMLITPIAPFRPRRWQGAIISKASEVDFTVLEAEKRPVSVSADFFEIRDVAKVNVKNCDNISVTLLFDSNHSFEERILQEQFSFD